MTSHSHLKTSSENPITSESDIENQFRKFMHNQEQNFRKFSKILDKVANKNGNRSSLYRKCVEFKKRGELSIKYLRAQQGESEPSLIQTQRRLPGQLQTITSSLPPPPSPNRSKRSSFTYVDSPINASQINEAPEKDQVKIDESSKPTPRKSYAENATATPIVMQVSNIQCISLVGWQAPEKIMKIDSSSEIKAHCGLSVATPDSINRSSSPSVRSITNIARYTEKWIDPAPQIESPVQAAFHDIDRKNDQKLKTGKRNIEIVTNAVLLENSLEKKLSSLIPKSVQIYSPGIAIANQDDKFDDHFKSPSINIRHLSQGSHFLSSEIENTSDRKEYHSSQILIKDEIVSKFKDDEESCDQPIKEVNVELNQPFPSKSYERDDLARYNSPKVEGHMQNIVQNIEVQSTEEKKDDQIDEQKRQIKVPESTETSSSIDFSKLTSEDKSIAIADFIMETLLMEVFSTSSKLTGRMVDAYINIVSKRNSKSISDIRGYLSDVFTYINDSPDEQMHIYIKLNTPIIHNDVSRLLLASSIVEAEDQIAISALPYESVLNIQMYIILEEELRDTIYSDKGLSNTEIEQEHIFHKLIFDALNETLDYERIGGMKTILPSFFSAYKPERQITPEDCAVVLEKSKQTVLEWSQERNGLLAENLPRESISDELNFARLENIREETLLRHLQTHFAANQDKWYDFSDETLEVFLGLSDYVFDSLLEETIANLVSIKNAKSRE